MSEEKSKFKVKEYLTTEAFQLAVDTEYHLKFTSAITKAMLPDPANKAQMKEAEVINVVDLDNATDHPQRLIVNFVLAKTLNEKYPKEKYVGKSFLVIKRNKKGGGKANPFVLAELDV